MKKHIVPIIAVVLFSLPYLGLSQHGLGYNQFGQLRNSLNGSLSMMDPDGGAAVLTRLQWVGMDGAPQSYWASGHVGIRRLGMTVGLDLKQANMGGERDRELSTYVASAVRLTDDSYLGLSVGGGLLLHNRSSVDSNDPTFVDARYGQGMMSIGTSYFREDRYYVGVSIPRLALGRRGEDRDYAFYNMYTFTGGALFRIDDGFHVRPSFLVSHVENPRERDKTRFDISALAFFAEQFGLGVGVQNRWDVSFLAQVNIGDFGIGYSYQINPGARITNSRVTTNTHEVGIRYRVGGLKML